MRFARISCAIPALLLSAMAHAVPVEWTLNNVVFADGAVATGSFVFDADAPADQEHQWADYDTGETQSLYYAQGYLSFDMQVSNDAWSIDANFSPEDGGQVRYIFGNSFDGYYPVSDQNSLHIECPDNSCIQADYEATLLLEFAAPLTNAGGEIAVSGYFSAVDYPGSEFNYGANIAGGTVVANVVPVPAAVWLFVSALGLLGWRSRFGV